MLRFLLPGNNRTILELNHLRRQLEADLAPMGGGQLGQISVACAPGAHRAVPGSGAMRTAEFACRVLGLRPCATVTLISPIPPSLRVLFSRRPISPSATGTAGATLLM